MVKLRTRAQSVRFAGYKEHRPVRIFILLACAFLSVLVWWGVEKAFGGFRHAASVEMHEAARLMQISTQVIRAKKKELDLLQDRAVDPTLTGLIGPEYSEITTSIGILQAKRSATNPDLAAAITREIQALHLPAQTPVILLMSGSLVGANVAALAAVTALNLQPIVINSLSSSMYGATDPNFTWLDMQELLEEKAVLQSKVIAAVLGGNGSVARGLSEEGRTALKESILKAGVPLVEGESVSAIIQQLSQRIYDEVGGSWPLLINVGGSVAALGTCAQGNLLPSGLIQHIHACGEGELGLIHKTLEQGGDVLHILNIKSLTGQWGLPYDPIPLPMPGNNHLIYGNYKK